MPSVACHRERHRRRRQKTDQVNHARRISHQSASRRRDSASGKSGGGGPAKRSEEFATTHKALNLTGSDFRPEALLSEGYGRNKDRFTLGERPDIGGSENAPLHVNPHAGVSQEGHGLRTPLIQSAPSTAPFLLSASHVAPASSGRVR